MPNWVKNEIIFKGKKASNIISKLLSLDEDGNIMFDFNKIIPMPQELNIEHSSVVTAAMKYIVFKEPERLGVTNEEFEKIYNSNYGKKELGNFWKEDEEYLNRMWTKGGIDKEESLSKAKQQLLNILHYDAPNWYYWCRMHWNTKWNACETRFVKANENECEVYFETAWNMPIGIIVELVRANPKLEISGQFSSEDVGSMCGIFYTDKKKLNLIQYKDLSNQAYETYIDMWGMPSDLAFNKETNKYEWMD